MIHKINSIRQKLTRKLNSNSVSSTISVILVLMIFFSATGAVLLWGPQYIESEETRYGAMATADQLKSMAEAWLEGLIPGGNGSSYTGELVIHDGTIEIDSVGDPIIIVYSPLWDVNVSGLDDTNPFFSVYGLNNVDNATIYLLDDTCFLAGTKITMADGSYKNIADIRAGDVVKSYDEKTNTLQNDKVMEIFHDTPDQMISDYYLIVNNLLEVTPDHLLYINNEWVQAGDLKIGDHLFKGKVTSLEKIYEKVPSYNFETEKYHTYFVVFGDNIVIAHNAGDYTHALYGNDEDVSLSRQSGVTDNDYTALLSMDKIFELLEIPYKELKEILDISDDYEVFITIGNKESTFLNYMPNKQIWLDSASAVVSYSENIIIVDSAGYAYATISVTVASFK